MGEAAVLCLLRVGSRLRVLLIRGERSGLLPSSQRADQGLSGVHGVATRRDRLTLSSAHGPARRYLVQRKRRGQVQRELPATDPFKPDSAVHLREPLAQHEQPRFEVVVARRKAKALTSAGPVVEREGEQR